MPMISTHNAVAPVEWRDHSLTTLVPSELNLFDSWLVLKVQRGYGEEATSQEPRIHICQRPEDIKRSRVAAQGIGQHVFELVPTLLLNNPIMNPVHTHDSNYFPPAPPMSHVRFVSP